MEIFSVSLAMQNHAKMEKKLFDITTLDPMIYFMISVLARTTVVCDTKGDSTGYFLRNGVNK